MQENFIGVTELYIIGTDLFFAAKIKDSQNAILVVYGVLKLLRNPEVQMRCGSCIDDGVLLKTYSRLDELIVSNLIVTPMVNGEFGLDASDEVLVFYPEKEVWIQALLSKEVSQWMR